ncbi:hypothetical protein GCM10010372_82270 [Streptomyces tauricus]|uniref:hypothetical protein n=1 Tax=Streptomyces tauricus TaxID=68274 RepID=UPI00167B310C|nr:hypothetical protein [Streptomyces tauricus]GHA70648.1 hypothetical protein GCM10010372_82270 [Streptomyces tauricus]
MAEQRPNPRPDLDFTPVRNGMDYLASAVKNLTEGSTPPSDSDLKYAVLHLQAATEVLLKARLVREHWSLVFKEPGGASLETFENGKFESCTIAATMDRLDKIAKVSITPEERKAIKDLADDRNALTHYGHTANAFAVEARAARVFGFLLTFIHRQFRPELSRDGVWVTEVWVTEAMDALRTKLSGIEALVKDRMRRLSGELAPLGDRTVQCPDCRQWALVLSEAGQDRGPNARMRPPSCRFCLRQWGDPIAAAANYELAVLGEGNFGQLDCPTCEFRTLVIGANTSDNKTADMGICFNCAEVVERKSARQ